MKIYVKEVRRSGRFAAHLDAPDGELIVQSSRTPLFDAARVLKARGLTGRLEMVLAGHGKAGLIGDIDVLATKTVIEDRKQGPYIGRWKAFPRSAVCPPAARKGSG